MSRITNIDAKPITTAAVMQMIQCFAKRFESARTQRRSFVSSYKNLKHVLLLACTRRTFRVCAILRRPFTNFLIH